MIYYELWGNDTYSNETFLCGVYKHYSSARRAMKKHELDCQEYQGEGLRDTFWISKTSIEVHDEQADKRSRYISSIHRKLKDDKNLVLAHINDIYLYAKENIQEMGEYLFPLSDDFNDSHVLEIRFSVRRRYRSRTKFDFMLGVRCRDCYECSGLTTYMEDGTIDEICEAIEKPDIAIRYAQVLFNGLQDHYYSAL